MPTDGDVTVGVIDPSSFRDPMGFVFTRDGQVLRQVNRAFADEWDRFEGSELQTRLIADGRLIAHEPADVALAQTPEAHRVIRPTQLSFISYPYEWAFSQLKDAALATLEIQQAAVKAGFTLRDASAYNIQFVHGQPVLIDSLSFEQYVAGAPWRAYKQFCEHFLGPIALMTRRDIRLRNLLSSFMDGIPLDLTVGLLPRRAFLSLGLATHLYLHARAQARPRVTQYSKGVGTRSVNLPRLLESLRAAVEGLEWVPAGTSWVDYDERGSYSSGALASKDNAISSFVTGRPPSRVWDLGANAGRYSAIAANAGHDVLAVDGDAGAVERIYRRVRGDRQGRIHPLAVDLTNPSARIGWGNEERRSLSDRADANLLLALALIHHLAISAAVPLPRISRWLSELGPELIIEFVPPEDPKAAQLLLARRGESVPYDRNEFLQAFSMHWKVVTEHPIEDSLRSLFVLRRLD